MSDQTLGELKAYLRVDTTSLDVATAKAKAFGDGMASSFAKVGVAGAAIGLGAAGVAVDMAAKFQQQMTLIRTQAGDTTDNLDVLGKQILGLAGSVGFSPDSLAQAFYHMASAGITGAAGLDAIKMSAQLAAVGQSDLETTTQAVLFTLKAGLPDIHNATDAVGMLNAIVGQGDMRMNQLTESLSSGILPVAAQFGVSMRSLGAALTFMSDRGVPPAEATTRLRMSLALMAAPTKQATKLLTDAGLGFTQASYQVNAMTKALHDSGVSTTQLAEDLKKPDGIMVALKDLKDHLTAAGVSADMQNATLSRAFGGGKSGGTIMMLYGQLDAVKQKYDQLGAASKTFADSWATQQGTFDQRVKSLKSSLDSLIITAGNALLPMATQIITFFGDVAATLSGTETATSKTDTAAQSFAGTLKELGGYASTAMTVLGNIGKWMLDNKELVLAIGAGFATWKITSGIAGKIDGMLHAIPGTNLGSKIAPQNVFVTNWEMIAGGGGGGVAGAAKNDVGLIDKILGRAAPVAGVAGGVGGGAAAGGGSLAGAAALALPAAIVVGTTAVAYGIAQGINKLTGQNMVGGSVTDLQTTFISKLVESRGHLEAMNKSTASTALMQSEIEKAIASGQISTMSDLDSWVKNWNAADGAATAMNYALASAPASAKGIADQFGLMDTLTRTHGELAGQDLNSLEDSMRKTLAAGVDTSLAAGALRDAYNKGQITTPKDLATAEDAWSHVALNAKDSWDAQNTLANLMQQNEPLVIGHINDFTTYWNSMVQSGSQASVSAANLATYLQAQDAQFGAAATINAAVAAASSGGGKGNLHNAPHPASAPKSQPTHVTLPPVHVHVNGTQVMNSAVWGRITT